MKKYGVLIVSSFILCLVLVGCQGMFSKSTDTLKIGMLVGTGGIDDKTFNQGTWEGIQRYVEDHDGESAQFAKPSGEKLEDYITAAKNLIMAGSNVLVVPGIEFKEMVSQLQGEYPDVKFIMFDDQPDQLKDNTLSISFAENEAGFLVGIAAALESKTGQVGFIGGMKIPPVEKFEIGYEAGVAYANHTYHTHTVIADSQFEETFYEVQSGQKMAKEMYDKGIDIIFCAAGAVGEGVINEAKVRMENHEEVYVIGSDIDQYEEGELENNQSVVLTSAIKRIDRVVYDILDDIAQGEFPGGQMIRMDVKSNGVGIPLENPNLGNETIEKIKIAITLMKKNELIIPETISDLKIMLDEYQ